MKILSVVLSIILSMLTGHQAVAIQTNAPASDTPHPTLHVVILGDSNTWIGGDDCDKAKGWNKWFKEYFQPASIKSYARSGATWSNTKVTKKNPKENIGSLGNDNVIYNQVVRLIDAVKSGRQRTPDLVIIGAGTNDLWFKDKRPGLYTKTADQAMQTTTAALTSKPVNQVLSLSESVRYNCELLRQAFPTCRIIILTPMQTTKVPTEEIRRGGDIMQAVAEKMKLDVIRQDAPSFIDRKVEEKKFTHTYDGVHTSEAGAKNNAKLLSQKISQLIDKE